MKSYRYALFDLDGTLIDSFQALTTAVNRTAAEIGHPALSLEEVRAIVGEGVERLLQKAFQSDRVAPAVIESFERHYDEVCCEESRILSEVERTLDWMKDARVRMAVCTNKPTSFSVKILEHLGLSPYFEAVVGPDEAGARKPDRRHVLYTLARIGGRPDETLFIGDMPIDVAAARDASLDVAVIATGSSSTETLVASSPDYLLGRFSELKSLFALAEVC
jgi:phosphoglycolate phosphatase